MNQIFLRRFVLFVLAFMALAPTSTAADPVAIPLWTEGATGSEARMNEPEQLEPYLLCG